MSTRIIQDSLMSAETKQPIEQVCRNRFWSMEAGLVA